MRQIGVLVLCIGFLGSFGCGRSGGNRAAGNNGAAAGNSPNAANSINSSNAGLANSGPQANALNANTNEIVASNEDISRGLLQMEDAWNDAYVRRDEAWFQQNLADDYTEIGDTGKTINDKAGAIEAMKDDKSVEIITQLSDTKVRIEGDAAVITGVNHVRLKDEHGRQQDYKHRFTDTFIKRGDRWLVWANQATRMP